MNIDTAAIMRLQQMQDQSWAGVRDDEDVILYIAEHGPSGLKDMYTCRALACHVWVELQLRKMERVVLEDERSGS